MAVKWQGDNVLTKVRRAVLESLVVTTEEVRSEALRLIMRTRKTGRLYRRRGVVHRASAPGEAPASDTGRLAGSIRSKVDRNALVGTVSASTLYAAALEFGSRRLTGRAKVTAKRIEFGTTSRAARPFMRPALGNKKRFIEREMAAAVRAALK